MPHKQPACLTGVRVLVVEDEPLIRMMAEDMLAQAGCQVFGSAGRVKDALALIADQTPDLALLDINIHGDFIFPVAEALAQRDVPVIFCTGYDVGSFNAPWRDSTWIRKPWDLQELVWAMRGVLREPLSAASARTDTPGSALGAR